ncbi:MAG: helix-turn-helix transcriptional regulator [Chitinophagales bacterium]|nr:helix-turn-helix transcriptional regulator [Chitinophagales bacterium]
MKSKTYIIRNMVCQRCVEAVEEVFASMDLKDTKVELGVVETLIPDHFFEEALQEKLQNRGFDLVKSKEEILVEKTKAAIVKLVHLLEENPLLTNSVWLENELQENYQKISRNFSNETDTTLEKYLILHKIEKAKELIQYNQLSLEAIAYKLAYKSLSHFSKQFKEIEKISLSKFRKNLESKRKRLDDL